MIDVEGLIVQAEGMPWQDRRAWMASVMRELGTTMDELRALPDDLKIRLVKAASKPCLVEGPPRVEVGHITISDAVPDGGFLMPADLNELLE